MERKMERKAAEELPSAAETPPTAAPIVAPRLIRDEGVAYPEQVLGERFYERVEVRSIPELDASGHVRSSSVETPQGQGFDEEATRAGVPVPTRINIGVAPLVIHHGLIDRVDLYTGGYPARFGRFAGGVVSAQMRGPEPALFGETSLRLFDVGGLSETPFARGRGSLYSYGAALLSLFRPEVKLDYRDYQARATYEPSARDRFSVFGSGSYEPLGEKRNGILTRLGDACRPKITFTW
jgi:hypothetical protein